MNKKKTQKEIIFFLFCLTGFMGFLLIGVSAIGFNQMKQIDKLQEDNYWLKETLSDMDCNKVNWLKDCKLNYLNFAIRNMDFKSEEEVNEFNNALIGLCQSNWEIHKKLSQISFSWNSSMYNVTTIYYNQPITKYNETSYTYNVTKRYKHDN